MNFNGRYVISPKSMSVLSNTFLIGIKHNFVCCSDEMNNIHFWKDPIDVLRNSGYVIRIHASHIQTMKITSNDEYLITAGLNDQMICKWKIDHIINDRNVLQFLGKILHNILQSLYALFELILENPIENFWFEVLSIFICYIQIIMFIFNETVR